MFSTHDSCVLRHVTVQSFHNLTWKWGDSVFTQVPPKSKTVSIEFPKFISRQKKKIFFDDKVLIEPKVILEFIHDE